MWLKYPTGINTAAKRLPYLQRLYELIRVDGNTKGWTKKREDMHDLIIKEILLQRKILRIDKNNPANLGDIIDS